MNSTVNDTVTRIHQSTQTVPQVGTETVTEHVPQTGDPECSHIVKTDGEESAAAKVLEARINGTPLEALCGYRWIPSRDPKQLPLCTKCKNIYDTYRMFNDGLNETPND